MLMAAYGLGLDVVRHLAAHDALSRSYALAEERRRDAQRRLDDRFALASLVSLGYHSPKGLEELRQRTELELAVRDAVHQPVREPSAALEAAWAAMDAERSEPAP